MSDDALEGLIDADTDAAGPSVSLFLSTAHGDVDLEVEGGPDDSLAAVEGTFDHYLAEALAALDERANGDNGFGVS